MRHRVPAIASSLSRRLVALTRQVKVVVLLLCNIHQCSCPSRHVASAHHGTKRIDRYRDVLVRLALTWAERTLVRDKGVEIE